VLALLLIGGAAFAFTRGVGTTTATGSEIVLFELDPARALQQFRTTGVQMRSVPDGVEVTSGGRSAGQLQIQPPLATSDFAIQLRMRFVSGTGSAGVFFHGDQTGSYSAVVNTSGQVMVQRNSPSQQQPQPLALDRQPAAVRAELGKDFELKVVDQGGKLTIFIDGIEYAKASEPSAGSGAIGIFVGSFNDPFTVVLTKVRITGTAVAGPQGGQGQQAGGCAFPPCPSGCGPPPLPPCPAGQGQAGGPPSTGGAAPVPKGPLLFQARFDGSAGDVTIEKTGTAATQVVNGELRVTVRGPATGDTVKFSLPQRPGPNAYTVEYDLLPSPNAVIGMEFVIRATQTRVFQLAIDAGMQARLTENFDGQTQLRAGPASVTPSSSGQFTLSIRSVTTGQDSTAEVWVNGLALFPGRNLQSGLVSTPTEPLSVRVFGQSAPGGSVTIRGIRLYQPGP
jgi:hypothetical protein